MCWEHFRIILSFTEFLIVTVVLFLSRTKYKIHKVFFPSHGTAHLKFILWFELQLPSPQHGWNRTGHCTVWVYNRLANYLTSVQSERISSLLQSSPALSWENRGMFKSVLDLYIQYSWTWARDPRTQIGRSCLILCNLLLICKLLLYSKKMVPVYAVLSNAGGLPLTNQWSTRIQQQQQKME